jgi:multidrug transporter EmrE-like cation transporter
MKHILSVLTKFWQWLTNRQLEVEHIGMGAVILISTWHVSQHMRNVEGSTIVAVIMGAVLGFLNAVFAMRFFEERKETRRPAGVGVLFFAAVSVWMQYGFYDEKSDLVGTYFRDSFGLALWRAPVGAW